MSRHDLIEPRTGDLPAVAGIDGRDYDVGPRCPRDELQRRLDMARALQRLSPPVLGPVRRWTI